MENTWKLSEAKMKLKNGKYFIVFDENDPINKAEEKKQRVVCIISPSEDTDDRDFQNAAIIKEAPNMLKTLLELRETLSKGKRGGFSGILCQNTINKIDVTLKQIKKL